MFKIESLILAVTAVLSFSNARADIWTKYFICEQPLARFVVSNRIGNSVDVSAWFDADMLQGQTDLLNLPHEPTFALRSNENSRSSTNITLSATANILKVEGQPAVCTEVKAREFYK